MIAITSAFLRLEEAITFYSKNASMLSRDDIYWSVSISDESAQPLKLINLCNKDRTAVTTRRDRCYAEGWNNAVSQLLKQEWPIDQMRVCFLGTGDVLVEAPSQIEELSDTIFVGRISRNNIVHHKLPVRHLSFATLRAWTPTCLFPARLFAQYRFPESVRIASDVDVFFECFDRGYNFKKTDSMLVEMEDGGLSSLVKKSIVEYRLVYEARYGFSTMARFAEILKKIRSYS